MEKDNGSPSFYPERISRRPRLCRGGSGHSDRRRKGLEKLWHSCFFRRTASLEAKISTSIFSEDESDSVAGAGYAFDSCSRERWSREDDHLGGIRPPHSRNYPVCGRDLFR